MIPHRTIDLLGVDKAAASLLFKSREALQSNLENKP